MRRLRIDVVMKMWALSPTRRSVLQLLAAMLATPLVLPGRGNAGATGGRRGLTQKGKGKGKGRGKSKNKKKKDCTAHADAYILAGDDACFRYFGGLADLLGAAECALCYEGCAPQCEACEPQAQAACESNCRGQGFNIAPPFCSMTFTASDPGH